VRGVKDTDNKCSNEAWVDMKGVVKQVVVQEVVEKRVVVIEKE
jgi:hypothetical protein